MNPNDRGPNTKKGADETPASPYGPHPRGVDEAAGGADSSPYENEPTGTRKDVADADKQKGRNADPTGDANEST